MKKISIRGKSVAMHKLSVDEYARWAALVEAMEHINETAYKKKIDLSKSSKWIKPLEINRYIQSRFPSLRHDIGIEENIT